MHAVWSICSVVGVTSLCWAGTIPSWVNDSSKLSKDSYTTACRGSGPSLDLARLDSLKSCKKSAAAALSKTFYVSSVSVQTEKSSGLHEEVRNIEKFENLSCNPLKEEISQEPNSFEVWTLCRFPLLNAKISQSPLADDQTKSDALINYTHGETRAFTVTVIPPCESIMVIGKNPRNIKCTSNPFTINVTPLDRELIVRGDTSVYQPKKIMLNAKEVQDESIQIILEAN